jgi:ABC-type transport system involved in cytochrome bd biosynthesis fused ATPase/permease subunit
MNREQAIKEVGKRILKPIYWCLVTSAATFISSPFVWIWFGWTLFWKVSLTGFVAMWIFYGLDNLVKKTVSELIDERLKEKEQGKSFKDKLKEKLNNSTNQ